MLMPEGSKWFLLLTIIILIGLKFGKHQSLTLAKKISESERWPFDDWEMSAQGLGYLADLSRDEAVRRLKRSAIVTDILFWCIIGASMILGLLLYFV